LVVNRKYGAVFSEIKVKGQKTFFAQKFIEYQISIIIPFSLKKNEKLNTSILENQEYSKSIEKLITKYQHKFKEQTKLDILWDNFKLEVRDKTIDHSKKLMNTIRLCHISFDSAMFVLSK
jgi:hypothetical protein